MGGLGSLSFTIPPPLRDELAVPTVYSNSHLAAGKDGRSSVTFKLPTTPGVYRLFVEGRSGERLGLYRGKIVVREPRKPEEPDE
jgi:uncharacterized protein YfaS (alpha-2-macroglobulin family)